jgi:uncharacterized protein (DUF1778 family)
MPSINLRDIPVETHTRIKTAAAFAGVTIREFVLERADLAAASILSSLPSTPKAPAKKA